MTSDDGVKPETNCYVIFLKKNKFYWKCQSWLVSRSKNQLWTSGGGGVCNCWARRLNQALSRCGVTYLLSSTRCLRIPFSYFQPQENYNEWRLIYFISFLLLVGFFVLNMFVGVVVENFHRCRAEQEKEERARRAAKRAKKIEERRRSKDIWHHFHFPFFHLFTRLWGF